MDARSLPAKGGTTTEKLGTRRMSRGGAAAGKETDGGVALVHPYPESWWPLKQTVV